MAAEADRLVLAQWTSPAFPVGGYAYSHGLEAAMASGALRDAADLEGWLQAICRFGSGRVDAVLLMAAMAPEADLEELAATAQAMAGSAERWVETRDQGAAFAAAVSATGGPPVAAMAYPVAFGAAARRLDLAPPVVAAQFLHAVLGNLVSAAVRFVPLSALDGQRVLARLHRVIALTVEQASALTPESVGSCVPGADLAAMAHETMAVRLFRT